MKTYILPILALAAGPALAQAYKCTDAAGRVAFQEQPCAAGARQATVKLAPVVEQTPEQKRILQAMAVGGVTAGMSASQVRQVWGAPIKVNKTVGAGGISEQWVYGNGQYIYLSHGVVVAMQTTQR